MNNCIDTYIAEIEDEGRKAYEDGKEYDENPYGCGTPERELWAGGYYRHDESAWA